MNEQEQFWAGEFGSEYTKRNAKAVDHSRIAMFSKIFAKTNGVGSVLELGANRGGNLRVLRSLFKDIDVSAVEINPTAFKELQEIPGIHAVNGSVLDYEPSKTYDFVLYSGVLVHINPDSLQRAYEVAYKASSRYVCVIESYNPTPVEVVYRGHAGKLFKRDFAGEMMDRYPLKLVDYGFVYRRDPHHPLDDATWFLMER